MQDFIRFVSCGYYGLFLSFVLGMNGVASAHPGHGPSETTGFIHYLLSPMHWGVPAVIAMVLIVAVQSRRGLRARAETA